MLKQLDKKFPIQSLVDQVLSLDFDRRLSINETNGTLFGGPYTTKPEFVGTPLGDILSSIENPGEARLMRLKPEESYMAHNDPDDRYHVVITTNPFCYMIDLDSEKMYHLPPDGNLWLMDTSPRHVAVNFGSRDRIHLNIRLLLPDIKENAVHIKMLGGDFDFKHVINTSVAGFINCAIKNKTITGFRLINDREIMINVTNDSILEEIKSIIIRAGLQYEITQL